MLTRVVWIEYESDGYYLFQPVAPKIHRYSKAVLPDADFGSSGNCCTVKVLHEASREPVERLGSQKEIVVPK